jgi:hypothetical protein
MNRQYCRVNVRLISEADKVARSALKGISQRVFVVLVDIDRSHRLGSNAPVMTKSHVFRKVVSSLRKPNSLSTTSLFNLTSPTPRQCGRSDPGNPHMHNAYSLSFVVTLTSLGTRTFASKEQSRGSFIS